VYLLGATGDDGLKAKGSYLLQWRLLERLKEVGCHWYDLGGIDPKSNPGVYHFKQGLSGDEAVEIGPYDAHGSLLSRLTADFGERLRRLAERTRQR
jgi:lipid II:glycine glycyltransferase (peptidoglycan interpeptide bridge formation enzyme)